MPNYDWRAWDEEPWQYRYPGQAIGAPEWVAAFSADPSGTEMRGWIDQAQDLQRSVAPQQRRVFISHRKADTGLAQQAAQAVRQIGVEYWLDVEDPTLAWLTGHVAVDAATRSAAVAATIEMALLNCTHVLAIITPNTKGSMWVPYEYGRVKDGAVVDHEAGCWTHVDTRNPDAFAEYLHLGEVHHDLAAVCAWLTR